MKPNWPALLWAALLCAAFITAALLRGCGASGPTELNPAEQPAP
jgi:hypothetical protein